MPSTHQPRVHDTTVTPERNLQPRVRALLLALVTLAATAGIPTPAATASDTSTRWQTFSESSGCEDPFTRTPLTSRVGTLGDSEAILGPFGTYFGRSISEVRTKLRFWTVPYSGGMRVRVHQAILPSLRNVAEALDAHARLGRIYFINSAGAFTPRTIAGTERISRHSMGLAIDLNPAQNPNRSDNVLITNMPDWYVDTWKQAGFCWGGDWVGSKDPMHFSWMGPTATPAPNDRLQPLPPKTSKTTFGGSDGSHQTEFGPVMSRYAMSVTDGNTNGTADVVGLRSHPSGAVIDMALSSLGFGRCSISRWFVPNGNVVDAEHVLFGDVDGDTGQDLIALSPSGASLEATVVSRRSRFETSVTATTGASADAVAVTGADFDGDHHTDIWEATPDGRLRVWRGPQFNQLLNDSALPDGAPILIAAGDRDGGDRPELYALYPGGSRARVSVLRHSGSWSRETSFALDTDAGSVVAIGASDYDGDGRADAQVLTTSGSLVAYIGNTSTGIPATRWFMHQDVDCDEPILLDYSGSFMDDDGNIFENDIESIARTGVTRGCNPPFNDRFCPKDSVTREQMAAFLVRALGLVQDTHPGFVDVPEGSTFVDDIDKLATAGITMGCNPPANDRFCPKDHVTREQMAAFLVRALDLTDEDHPGFGDVPADSTFVRDVGKLATAGITRGCNPPANDRFCPRDSVTREQMAAFLNRAGLGS